MKSYLFILVLMILSCDFFSDRDITYQLKLDNRSYSITDTLKAEFIIKNESGSDKTYHFNSGCQFVLEMKNDKRYFYGDGRACPAVLSSLTVKSEETLVLKRNITLSDIEGLDQEIQKVFILGFLEDENSPIHVKEITIYNR